MSGTLLMGLDIGGGGGRCLLVDANTGETTTATCSWRFPTAPGTGGLGTDLDLEAIRSGLAAVTREALAKANAKPGDVAAIATTSMRLGCVVIDAEGEPLLAVPNRDARAVVEGLTLAAQHGEALYARTGRWPYPIYAAARLGWLRAQRPDDFARAHALLSMSDWLTYELCGECVAEPSQAGETLLFDLERVDWAWDWIDDLELPRHLFPRVRRAGEVAGELSPRAADAFGLTAGIPVAIAGGDSQCAMLGAGALQRGDAVLIAGTTAPVQVVVDRPAIDAQTRCWSAHHVVPERWLIESNAGPMGETLDWFSQLLFPAAPEPVARLLGEAVRAEPGSHGMLSTLGAEVMNAKAMGIPVGALTLSHMASPDAGGARADLLRSVVEGMACAVRANLEQARAAAGVEVSPLRSTGGLSRSRTWQGILGAVLGHGVSATATPQGTALGAALCAGVGGGLYADLASAARSLVRLEAGPEPTAEHIEVYERVYQNWCNRRETGAETDAQSAASILPWALGAGSATAGDAQPIRPRILVTADFDPASLASLRELGQVEYASFRDEHRLLQGDRLVAALAGFQIFVTEIDLVDAEVIAALPDLRAVISCRGDAVNVDAAACSAFGVPLVRSAGRNADAVADLTLAFLLMLARKLPAATGFLRTGDIAAGDMAKMGQAFAQLQGRELWRKTIGLIGLGAVGRKVAQRAAPFGTRVLVADPHVDAEQAARVDARLVSLDELLAESDYVSLHASVSDETRGMIGERELAAMKREACLINTARAALVDPEALVAALRSGEIAGAALDTFAVEPPGSDDPLLSLDNVIVTPHVGGNTAEVAAHQGAMVVDAVARLLAGEAPAFLVDPDALDALRWQGARREPSAAQRDALDAGSAPAVSDLQRDARST